MALPKWLHTRQTEGSKVADEFLGDCSMTKDFVNRLGLVKELEGHTGCVNCIQWNSDGRYLASGSDDKTVIIWDALGGSLRTKIETPHDGNIFSVVWMTGGDEQYIASGAGDFKVCVLDVETKSTLRSINGHTKRVKRLGTAADSPGIFWSGGEDGVVRQWDLRERWSNDGSNVLINLLGEAGRSSEVKCISVCPGRNELMAVGANDPYVRVFDRRMITCSRLDYSNIPSNKDSGAVAYFVPGHLPGAESVFQKKLRPLTSTYITYNKYGTELLCNLGGEQVYLYDKFALYSTNAPLNYAVIQSCDKNILKVDGCSNGMSKNGHSKVAFKSLPKDVEDIKLKANKEFEAQNYCKAVFLYNQAMALLRTPHPILCGNRAAALMKRRWDGDIYAALRDCLSTLSLDSSHIKAHLRLAQCLIELEWLVEAEKCLETFKLKHPELQKAAAFIQREKELNIAKEKQNTKSESPSASDNTKPPLSRYTAANFLKNQNLDVEPMDSDDDSDSSRGSSEFWDTVDADYRGPGIVLNPEFSIKERECRSRARDYSQRYLGACNTTTDIKEANFFGGNGQFILAGSDDGKFFIWDRFTSNIVKVLIGDDAIVNCLQSHPFAPILATSGIDPVVRIWDPRPENGTENSRVVDDFDAVASSNQRRMNADPFETILRNMGVNVDEEMGEDNEGAVQCRPS